MSPFAVITVTPSRGRCVSTAVTTPSILRCAYAIDGTASMMIATPAFTRVEARYPAQRLQRIVSENFGRTSQRRAGYDERRRLMRVGVVSENRAQATDGAGNACVQLSADELA